MTGKNKDKLRFLRNLCLMHTVYHF